MWVALQPMTHWKVYGDVLETLNGKHVAKQCIGCNSTRHTNKKEMCAHNRNDKICAQMWHWLCWMAGRTISSSFPSCSSPIFSDSYDGYGLFYIQKKIKRNHVWKTCWGQIGPSGISSPAETKIPFPWRVLRTWCYWEHNPSVYSFIFFLLLCTWGGVIFLAGEILQPEPHGFLCPSFGIDRSVCQGKTSDGEGFCCLPAALSSPQRARPAFYFLPALGIRADAAANTHFPLAGAVGTPLRTKVGMNDKGTKHYGYYF